MGYTGDGWPATAAELNNTVGVSVDNIGNIFIVDIGNNNIRKVCAKCSGLAIPGIPNKEEKKLFIWPAPNDGFFTIYLSSSICEPVQVIITNIIGQKIKEITTTTNKEIEIKLNAPPGMYFLNAITEQGRQSAKVVVQ